jgi:hypothetical protein
MYINHENGKTEGLSNACGLGAPEIATHMDDHYNSTHVPRRQPHPKPIVKARIGPVKDINTIVKVMIREDCKRVPPDHSGWHWG